MYLQYTVCETLVSEDAESFFSLKRNPVCKASDTWRVFQKLFLGSFPLTQRFPVFVTAEDTVVNACSFIVSSFQIQSNWTFK